MILTTLAVLGAIGAAAMAYEKEKDEERVERMEEIRSQNRYSFQELDRRAKALQQSLCSNNLLAATKPIDTINNSTFGNAYNLAARTRIPSVDTSSADQLLKSQVQASVDFVSSMGANIVYAAGRQDEKDLFYAYNSAIEQLSNTEQKLKNALVEVESEEFTKKKGFWD